MKDNLRLAYLSLNSKFGINWYREANFFCASLAQKYERDIKLVVGVVSALSPATSWSRNKIEADYLLAITAGYNPAPMRFTTYGKNVVKATSIATGALLPDNAFVYDSAPKTHSFYRNIMNPEDRFIVTIDRHAYRVWAGLGSKAATPTIRPALYNKIAGDYRAVASEFGLAPSELQAILWCAIRNSGEEGES